MSTIHLHETTSATPGQFVAGLTDFGPGRSKLFGNSADQYLKVHSQGPDYADVTEGSGGIWERLHCAGWLSGSWWGGVRSLLRRWPDGCWVVFSRLRVVRGGC